jgi:ATP-binding cassette subfamily B protein
LTATTGSQALRNVLFFTPKHWTTRKALIGGIALAMSLATPTEVVVAVFAGRLVDALAQGQSAAGTALTAFVAMAGLGLAMVGLRHLAWWGVVPLTLGMMRNIAQDAFHRVQRFSTDWHTNSFAGSTVRKITRGMWAPDTQRRAPSGVAALARGVGRHRLVARRA